MNNRNILNIIENYTMPIVTSYKEKRNINKYINIKNIGYSYNDGEKNIDFYMLSDFVDNSIMIQDLQTRGRYVNVCYNNLMLSRKFPNGQFVIGLIEEENELSLHTWLEDKVDNEDKVFDYSKNIIINKEEYYNMINIKKLIRYDNIDFEKYKNKYTELFNEINQKESKEVQTKVKSI